MEQLLDQLKQDKNKNSTKMTYHKIWRKFNEFIIRLDRIPRTWEHRTAVYCAFLIVEKGLQSSTVRTYISAIKSVLMSDNYEWDNGSMILNTITRSCKMKNDSLKTRLPIRIRLLEIILCNIQKKYGEKQPYLEALYVTAFLIGYYGLFREGELSLSDHVMKAANIHEGKTKEKILIVLYSSKTHGKGDPPQKIKIIGKNTIEITNHKNRTFTESTKQNVAYFCPVHWILYYIQLRGSTSHPDEPFLIFRDKSPVKASHLREVLRNSTETVTIRTRII